MKAFLTGSNMNQESIFKRTLLLTGKLVGIFSIWVTLLSVIGTFAASRLVGNSAGSAADQGALVPSDTAKKDEAAVPRSKNAPAHAAPNKPNG